MKIKSTIIATTIFAASIASGSVSAQENQIQHILSGMIKQALHSASNEIDAQVDKNLISASHFLSLENEAPKGKVTITDIEDVSEDKTEANDE